jgi:WD40 repeat protein
VTEYLPLEQASDGKHEFVDGAIVAMRAALAAWTFTCAAGCAETPLRSADVDSPRTVDDGVGAPSGSAPLPALSSAPLPKTSSVAHVLGFTPKSPTGPAYAVDFSRGDETLATWCRETCPWGSDQASRLVVWSLRDLRAVRDVVPNADDLGSGRLHAAAFTPDGARYITSTHTEVTVWEPEGWTRLGSSSFGAIYAGWSASPDGRHVVAADVFGKAALFDATSGKVRQDLQLHDGAGSISAATAWSGDSKVAAVEGNGNVRTMRVDGSQVVLSASLLRLNSERVSSVDLSHDGAWIAVVEGGRVTVRRVGGEARHVLVDGSLDAHPPASASFSPVDDRIVVVDVFGVARRVDLSKDGPTAVREASSSTRGAWWSPRWSADGRFVAWGGAEDGSVAVWDATSAELRRYGARAGARDTTWSWSHRGGLLVRATADAVEVWDVERGVSLRSFTVRGLAPTAVAFSRDDRFVAAAAGDVHVVRIADGRTLVLRTRGIAKSRVSAALVTDVGWAGDATLGREIVRLDGGEGVPSGSADELRRAVFGP